MTLSVGLLISAGSKSPDEAMMKALVTATPLLNVSGLVFPTWSMPPFFRILAKLELELAFGVGIALPAGRAITNALNHYWLRWRAAAFKQHFAGDECGL